MSLERILENWSDYDKLKRKGEDSRYFSCTEEWEVNYLIDKIKKTHGWLSHDKIRLAIRGCCEAVRAPRPRRDFVKCVLQRLGAL